MVKGNWERRAELAAKKRAEAKEKKLRQTTPSHNSESAHSRLLRDPYLINDGCKIQCWLAVHGSQDVCKSWLRTGDCSAKRCRFPHLGTSLALIRQVPYDSFNSGNSDVEAAIEGPFDVERIGKKDIQAIKFIAVDGMCVFDHDYSLLWDDWLGKRQKSLRERQIKTIPEIETDSDKQNVEGVEIGLDLMGLSNPSCPVASRDIQQAVVSSRAHFDTFFLSSAQQCPNVFHDVLLSVSSFLEDAEIVLFFDQSSGSMRRYVQQTPSLRDHRKEAFARIAGQLSKQKKQERKKKIKQANAKHSNKKDAFARGGNTGN